LELAKIFEIRGKKRDLGDLLDMEEMRFQTGFCENEFEVQSK